MRRKVQPQDVFSLSPQTTSSPSSSSASSRRETDVTLVFFFFCFLLSTWLSCYRSDASGYGRKIMFEEKRLRWKPRGQSQSSVYLTVWYVFSKFHSHPLRVRKKYLHDALTSLIAAGDVGDSCGMGPLSNAYKVCRFMCVCVYKQSRTLGTRSRSSLSSLRLWPAATGPYRLPHCTCWD